jgi:hypothetical protein
MRLPVGYDTITKKHFIIITRSVATVIVAEPNEIIAALFEVPEDQVVRWKRRLGAGQSDICYKFH